MTSASSSRIEWAARDGWAAQVGVIGGALGVFAGLVELTIGSSIRPWIGDKNDPVRLGLVTIVLAVVALTSAIALHREAPSSLTPSRRMARVLGMLVPALLCATTVGRLWYLPGALLLAAALATASSLRGNMGTVLDDLERNATLVFTAILALLYVGLGFAALGVAGWSGIGGGLLVLGVLVVRPHRRPLLVGAVLMGAVAPFAVATWWSVVTPVIALLVAGLGSRAIVTEEHRGRRTRCGGVRLRLAPRAPVDPRGRPGQNPEEERIAEGRMPTA